MDLFTKLFGEFLVFVYHCFDRIVIHGYLTALSRPELVVHFFREIVGVAEVSKEALSQRTADYQNWVEAYARNHSIPIEWAEKGVRKEDHVLAWLRRMEKRNAYGVYFIFKSMEQGPTFRISLPKYPAKDPHYRIVAHQRSRFTHYYFYVRDEALGPMVVRVASFFPFQTTYYLNGHSFIEQELKRAGIGFRKEDNAFLAVADPAALQAAADRLSPDVIRRRLDYCRVDAPSGWKRDFSGSGGQAPRGLLILKRGIRLKRSHDGPPSRPVASEPWRSFRAGTSVAPLPPRR